MVFSKVRGVELSKNSCSNPSLGLCEQLFSILFLKGFPSRKTMFQSHYASSADAGLKNSILFLMRQEDDKHKRYNREDDGPHKGMVKRGVQR